MDKKPDRSIFIIAGSLGLLLLAIIVTNVMSTNNNKSDIRAKAAVDTGLKYVATISVIDEAKGVLTLENVFPYDNEATNFGTWSVQVPSSYNLLENPVGTKVTVVVDAKSMDVKTKTMTAKQITKR